MARPTAAQVRSAVLADKKAVKGLSEKAQANLSSRGRLSGEVKAAFNANRRGVHRYVDGNSKTVAAETAARRESLREAGHAVGARGPLPKSLRPKPRTRKA